MHVTVNLCLIIYYLRHVHLPPASSCHDQESWIQPIEEGCVPEGLVIMMDFFFILQPSILKNYH
jgi:hypothetical protein